MFKYLLNRHLGPKCLRIVRYSSSENISLNLSMHSQTKSDYIYIEAISPLGFRLNNRIRIIGPMVAFPKTLLQWNVNTPEDLAPAAFSLFSLLDPQLDMLIIGVGDKNRVINPKVMDYFRTTKQTIQVLPTNQAVGLFNFLNKEERYIAAALIPPQTVIDALAEGMQDPYVFEFMEDTFSYEHPLSMQKSEDEVKNLETKENTTAPVTPAGLFNKTPIGKIKSAFGLSLGEKESFKEVSKDIVEERRKKVMERLQSSKTPKESNNEEGSDKPS